jgi:hypothetical protein
MVGPNPDQLKPNTATVAKHVENGGGGMPVSRGQLTPAQIHAVAQFVAQNASNSSARASGSACRPGLAQRQPKHPFGCRSAARLLVVRGASLGPAACAPTYRAKQQ